jgi:hypothetical protein
MIPTRRAALAQGGNRFSDRIMRKRDEVLLRFNRIRTEEMESVAGISRPRRGAFRGAGPKLAPSAYLPVEYAPLRRKGLRAVRSPSLAARSFSHRREGVSLPCMRGSVTPW